MNDCKGAARNAAEYLEELGCTLTTRFVPWSLSRSAKENTPSLNWDCLIRRDTHSHAFPYTKGYGYCHACQNPILFPDGRKDGYLTKEAIRHECETGHKAPPLTLDEVCYSLFMDAYDGSFEDWCSDYCYSDDSIKAKAMYEECYRTHHALKRMFGDSYDSLMDLLSQM